MLKSQQAQLHEFTHRSHTFCFFLFFALFAHLIEYRMEEAKVVKTHLAQHFKLFSANSPKNDKDEHQNYMANIPYSGSLMYLMISTRSDLAYVASLVSKYMANPRKRH